MKYIIIFLLLVSFVSYGQEPVYTPMRSNYQFRGIKVDSLFLVPSFSDTSAANLSIIKNIPGALMRTGNDFYMRNSSATGWLQNVNIGGGASSPINFITDIYRKGTSDTIAIYISGGDTETEQFAFKALYKAVDTIYRTAGKDSIFFKIGGTTYKIKDSTSAGPNINLQQVTQNGNVTDTGLIIYNLNWNGAMFQYLAKNDANNENLSFAINALNSFSNGIQISGYDSIANEEVFNLYLKAISNGTSSLYINGNFYADYGSFNQLNSPYFTSGRTKEGSVFPNIDLYSSYLRCDSLTFIRRTNWPDIDLKDTTIIQVPINSTGSTKRNYFFPFTTSTNNNDTLATLRDLNNNNSPNRINGNATSNIMANMKGYNLTIDSAHNIEINADTIFTDAQINFQASNGNVIKAGDFTDTAKIGNVLYNHAANGIYLSSANYDAYVPGVYIIAEGSNTYYFNLPNAEDFPGQSVIIVNTDLVHDVQIGGGGGHEFDRGTGGSLNTVVAKSMVVFYSDGSNWYGFNI